MILAIQLVPLALVSAAKAVAWSGSVLFPLSVPVDVTGSGGYTAGPNQVVGFLGATSMNGNYHAVQWTGSVSDPIDLNPPGFSTTFAQGTDGVNQVGLVQFSPSDPIEMHALLWSGTASSAIDLNPAPGGPSPYIVYTSAQAVSGNEQVGYGYLNIGATKHAMLWHGSSASAVDLHPTNIAGLDQSEAYGTDGVHQVGIGWYTNASGTPHAMLWTGAAGTAIDLHPTNLSGFTLSQANGVNGSQQVGDAGVTAANAHAMLWTGTANSAVDLHPASLGFTYSDAYSTNGISQVGVGYSSTLGYQALLWSGTANSAVKLQSLLPANFGRWEQSYADDIDSSGNVYGWAVSSAGIYAVEWSSVPEPAPISVLSLVGASFLLRRPKQHRLV